MFTNIPTLSTQSISSSGITSSIRFQGNLPEPPCQDDPFAARTRASELDKQSRLETQINQLLKTPLSPDLPGITYGDLMLRIMAEEHAQKSWVQKHLPRRFQKPARLNICDFVQKLLPNDSMQTRKAAYMALAKLKQNNLLNTRLLFLPSLGADERIMVLSDFSDWANNRTPFPPSDATLFINVTEAGKTAATKYTQSNRKEKSLDC